MEQRVSIGLVALWALAGPAAATPEVPAGCTPYLTVQTVDCEVDIYMRCDKPDGASIRVQNYGPDGLDTIEEMTADWSVLFSVDVGSRSGLVVRDGPAKPISRREILEDGVSDFDYPVDFYFRRPAPYEVRMTGAFRLTGARTEVDGHSLLVMENRILVDIPPPLGPLETVQAGYYSEEFDAFLEGAGSLRLGDRVTSVSAGPATFAAEDERGWLATTPLYNCAADEAGWRVWE